MKILILFSIIIFLLR